MHVYAIYIIYIYRYMKLFIEVVNHLASKYYENGGWTSITRFPASWLNLQVLGKMCIFIELDDGKIYRKPLYLMVKTMVSCRFSLKPIHWYIQNIPKYQPMGAPEAPSIAFGSHPKAPGQAIPLRKYPFFLFAPGTTAGSFEPIVYVYVEFGLPCWVWTSMNFLMRSQNWTSWRRMAQAGDWNFRPIQCLGDFGTMGFAKQALFLAEEFPQVSFCHNLQMMQNMGPLFVSRWKS